MNEREYRDFTVDVLRQRLGEEAEVSLLEVDKPNDTKREAVLLKGKQEGLCPILYLDGLYDEYQRTGDEYSGADRCISVFSGKEAEAFRDLEVRFDWEFLRPRLEIRLVEKERNRAYLQDKVYEGMLDLAVMFGVVFRQKDGLQASIPVTQALMESCGIGREELSEAAWQNLQREEFDIKPMSEILQSLMGEDVFLPEFLCGEGGTELYVATNEWDLFGARVMCRKDLLGAFAGGLGRNLYLLPSSVHEIILVRDEGNMDVEQLREVVHEVNGNEGVMRNEDILSDSVYYFDRETGEVRIAE